MGLFDGLKGTRQVSLTPRASMLLACISMVAADGDIDDDELAIIRRIDGPSETADWSLAVEVWKQVSGPIECVRLTASFLDENQRCFTMVNLIDIAMADGVLAGAERILLEEYVNAFQLDEDFIHGVVTVVSMKNDQDVFAG